MAKLDPRLNLYTITGVCSVLQIRDGILKKMIREGRFPPPLKIDSRPVWSEQDLIEFIERLNEERGFVPMKPPAQVVIASDPYEGELPEPLRNLEADLVTAHDGPSVYFLLLQLRVVYVGSSINPVRRIQEHRDGSEKTPAKVFDTGLIYPVPLQEMIEKEKAFIAILDPPLNSNCRYKGPR